MTFYAPGQAIDEAIGAMTIYRDSAVERTLLPKTLAHRALRSLVTNGDDAYDDLQALLDVLLEDGRIRPVRQRRRSGKRHAKRWLRDAPQRRAELLDEAFRWALNEVRPLTPSRVRELILERARQWAMNYQPNDLAAIIPPNVTVQPDESQPGRFIASINVPELPAATGEHLDLIAQQTFGLSRTREVTPTVDRVGTGLYDLTFGEAEEESDDAFRVRLSQYFQMPPPPFPVIKWPPEDDG